MRRDKLIHRATFAVIVQHTSLLEIVVIAAEGLLLLLISTRSYVQYFMYSMYRLL